MKSPDFFKKGFTMTRVLYCDTCKGLTDHQIELIRDCPYDNAVHALICCHVCYHKGEELKKLDIEVKSSVKYQRFFVEPYVYLVLHPNFLKT